MTRRSLTGIKPTGIPHLGNYVGAIRPALALAGQYDAYYFVADYHALTTIRDPEEMALYTRSVLATWLACGVDASKVTFYRQSDVPETFELAWVLSCMTPKGMMNRAHAYKSAVDANLASGDTDPDVGVNMGLFNYPVLMAADILVVNPDVVPVGHDQKQHVEYTRDIAERFNNAYPAFEFKIPESVISDDPAARALPGLDGRKMSKSYGNTIPLFAGPDEIKRLLRRVKTDSSPLEAPKDPDSSSLVSLYEHFSTPLEFANLKDRLRAGGLGWGHVKAELAERIDASLSRMRIEYERLLGDPAELDAVMARGAERVRDEAAPLLADVRRAIGITGSWA